MGHERVGTLPKTQEWRSLVAQLGQAALSNEAADSLASSTLHQVRHRFDRIQQDTGVQAAFGFLLALSTSHTRPDASGKASPPLTLTDRPSVLRLVTELGTWVRKHQGSSEYGELAQRAAADAIAAWVKARTEQRDLFSPEHDTESIWRAANNGAAFSEISRVFFGKFVERYLKYFLEREASATLPTIAERDQFSHRLESQIDALSHHAFETSKITQSFAAGWFNKHLAEGHRPPDSEITGFLSVAFGKLREELRRESE